MRVVDRLVVTLAALFVLAFGVAVLALVAGWNGVPWLLDLLAAARAAHRVEAVLTGLLGVAVALYLLAVGWQREGRMDVIRQAGALGEISVSLRAVEAVVEQSAEAVRGVKDVEARLRQQEGALVVDLNVGVTAERSVPEVSGEVQQRVAERIREIVGVEVAHVGVQVRHIEAERRARIE